ncbi:MAG: HPr(Ser) kinase/phosphatase, partial [Lachnospiraceae bacterium]|nr:HPr(Ser) kinase/phosphatase [Lachnospiraceae bacterium]
MSSVSVSELIDKLKLVNLTPDINVEDIKINQPDINRPALQLAGFLEHFETGRVQIIGFVEYTYMNKLDESVKKERYEHVLCDDTPCYVFCRDLQPDELFLEIARAHNVAVLMS